MRIQNTSGRTWQFIIKDADGVQRQSLDEAHQALPETPTNAAELVFAAALRYYDANREPGERTPLVVHRMLHVYKSLLQAAKEDEQAVSKAKTAVAELESRMQQKYQQLLGALSDARDIDVGDGTIDETEDDLLAKLEAKIASQGGVPTEADKLARQIFEEQGEAH